ncbi:helix-turn-helix domain-containing protein [Granulicatella sp. zg-ZJ]|uniref:helix-turn-helix domain-containing protein n=1 Tax=Granulicatella sp. zg-ZJ TaxID=2678504 RepID=UPI001F0748F6|nr:helix-turn-helix transcriptional regulator [Granulicatella sp. zg-ZJ]
MNRSNIEVGLRIKQIRLSLGETMEQFGERFNTSKGTVNNWEKGRNFPNKKNLLEIAQLDKISVDELLYGNILEIARKEINSTINFYKSIGFNYVDFDYISQKVFDEFKKEYSAYTQIFGKTNNHTSFKSLPKLKERVKEEVHAYTRHGQFTILNRLQDKLLPILKFIQDTQHDKRLNDKQKQVLDNTKRTIIELGQNMHAVLSEEFEEPYMMNFFDLSNKR